MLKIATVFSGIGAAEEALIRMGVKHKIVFACDNGDIRIDYDRDKEFAHVKSLKTNLEKKEYVDTLYKEKSRRTNYVKQTYLANYQLAEKDYYQDICLLDGRSYRGKVDILVGGSPCQSFSSVGFQKGLDDTRGTLFYEYARLIKEIKPKVFIYENVRGLTTHDQGNTWKIMQGVFNKLGYNIKESLLDAKEYGIPQTRRRLFVVGISKSCPLKRELIFPPQTKKLEFTMQDFLETNCSYGNCLSKKGELRIGGEPGTVDPKYTLSKLVKKYVMTPGTKTFRTTIKTDLPIARTILSTMGNRHRAGVDNYITENGKLRMLTEREAMRLMGYPDTFKIVVSRAQAYKQAGNSIVVDVMMAVIKSILNTGVIG